MYFLTKHLLYMVFMSIGAYCLWISKHLWVILFLFSCEWLTL